MYVALYVCIMCVCIWGLCIYLQEHTSVNLLFLQINSRNVVVEVTFSRPTDSVRNLNRDVREVHPAKIGLSSSQEGTSEPSSNGLQDVKSRVFRILFACLAHKRHISQYDIHSRGGTNPYNILH